MASIIVTEFVSLDGVMEDPGGSEGTRHGGWSFEFNRSDEGDKFKLDETMESDGLLLGHKTWSEFAKWWPERDGSFADKFNAMPKYVVGSSVDTSKWNNSVALDSLDAVRRLKDEQEGTYVVHGSAQLTQSLIDEDLVDELRLMVFPVVLGEGKRVFGPTSDKKRFALAESRTLGDEGIVLLIYRHTR